MGGITLADIRVTSLERIPTPGGDVLHAMKKSDAGYQGFGEAYFSSVAPGVIKAWKRHTKMTMNLVVPVGLVKFVFCLHGNNETRVEEIGTNNYVRLTVPPNIWFGFKGMLSPHNLVLNIASIIHNADEVERLEKEDIEYDWK